MPEAGRVIAGTARGIRLEGASEGTRPLADRVKESLFASLESEGALSEAFLDLFAGTGAAGIEALSRGAGSATFVEHDSRACAVIEANLKRAHLERGRVVHTDAIAYLEKGLPLGQPGFRAVFVDPPYDSSLLVPAIEVLSDVSRRWLADDAIVVAKHFWRDVPETQFGSLAFEKQRRFGETMLTFYRQTIHQP